MRINDIQDNVLENVPHLRRYAVSLCSNREDAEDLVQSTLERALQKLSYWKPGTNLRAWMFTIMHNVWVNELRKRSGEMTVVHLDSEGAGSEAVDAVSTENPNLLLRDLERGLQQLSDDHREALLLVVMQHFSYKEAARIAGISIGTLMSRLHRARRQLQEFMTGGQVNSLRRVK